MVKIADDRTSDTVFYPSTDPLKISFKTSASDADTFNIPYGTAVEAFGSSTDTDDEIATFVCSGSKVTVGLVNDGGGQVNSDRDLVGEIILRSQ